VCEGQTYEANATAGMAGYWWDITAGTIESGNGTDTVEFKADGSMGNVTLDVTVFDANGCNSTCSVVVPLYYEELHLGCNITAPDVVCADTGGHVANATAGLGIYSWGITGGTITSGNGTDTVVFAAGNESTVTLWLEPWSIISPCSENEMRGCSVEVQVAQPECDITAPEAVCADSGGHSANATAGMADYWWEITGGTIDSGNGTDTIQWSAGAGPKVTLEVTVFDANGCNSTCSAEVEVDLVHPAIEVTKTADTPVSKANDTVNYTIFIENTGDIALANITVSDSLVGNLTAHFPDKLAVGGNATYTYPYTVRVNDTHPLQNIVTVHSKPDHECLDNDITANDRVEVDLVNPAIEVTKRVDTTWSKANDTVQYTIRVENTGDTALCNLTVYDTVMGNMTADFP